MLIFFVQDVQKACNNSYWNATDRTCLSKLEDVYAVLDFSPICFPSSRNSLNATFVFLDTKFLKFGQA